MRYSKDSIVISETADEPILRTVYSAGHVTFEQLYDSVCPYLRSKTHRDGLSWRVRRLVRHDFLDAGRIEGLEPVLSLGESGELYLQGKDGAIVQRRTRAKGTKLRSQVWHDIELFGIQLALRRAGVVLTWQSEAEVRAQNRISSLRFVKEYDAVVTFRVGGSSAEIGLEFERTLKSAEAYTHIFGLLKNETRLARFLFLVPDSQSILHLRDASFHGCPHVCVGITHEFCANPVTAALLDLRHHMTACLLDCLRLE